MKKLRVAVVYNAYEDAQPEAVAGDKSTVQDLRQMIRCMPRTLRRLGHAAIVVHLAGDLASLQRKLTRLRPDVVFRTSRAVL